MNIKVRNSKALGTTDKDFKTFEEGAEVDIAAVHIEIEQPEDELKNVQTEIDEFLKELTA